MHLLWIHASTALQLVRQSSIPGRVMNEYSPTLGTLVVHVQRTVVPPLLLSSLSSIRVASGWCMKASTNVHFWGLAIA